MFKRLALEVQNSSETREAMSVLARIGHCWRRALLDYRATRMEGLAAMSADPAHGTMSCGHGPFAALRRSYSAAEVSSSSSSSPGQEEENGLQITEACAERIRELRRGGGGGHDSGVLRVRVDSGGCSGFQYTFDLDTEAEEGDRVFTKEDVKVVVDEVSMQFLKGATVDYTEELIKASFEVTSNPNAESSCGCGNSFVPT